MQKPRSGGTRPRVLAATSEQKRGAPRRRRTPRGRCDWLHIAHNIAILAQQIAEANASIDPKLEPAHSFHSGSVHDQEQQEVEHTGLVRSLEAAVCGRKTGRAEWRRPVWAPVLTQSEECKEHCGVHSCPLHNSHCGNLHRMRWKPMQRLKM